MVLPSALKKRAIGQAFTTRFPIPIGRAQTNRSILNTTSYN